MKLKTLMLLTLVSGIAMADTASAGSSGSDAHARALFYGLMYKFTTS